MNKYLLPASGFSITFFVCLFFVFVSCNSRNSSDKSNQNDSTSLIYDTLQVASEHPEITAYKIFLHKLDSTNAVSATTAVNELKRAFNGKSSDLCDLAYIELQQLLDTIELRLNEKLNNDTTNYNLIFEKKNIPAKLQKAKNELEKNGFIYASSEGIIYITQNRGFVISNLLSFFTKTMQTYLIQIDKENKEGFMEDAGIIITPQQYIDRVIWHEKFIADNPDFILLKNCKAYKKAYLTYLLTGIDNTSLYDYDDETKLSTYFQQAYNYALKTYPESETASIIQPYMQAIEQKQKTVVEQLLKKYTIKGLIYSQGI
jgi:hypothetical protein